VPSMMSSLRKAFDSDKTLSKEWRLGQLRAFQQMLQEGRNDLSNALLQDLHKSAFESYATEISLVESEIHTAITHLEEWMSAKYTNTSALNWPAGSYTLHDPLGVVLIMGSWNYPVQLTLAPVVGAIAGGNCVVIRPGSYAVATSHAICRLVDKYMDKDCIRVAEGDRSLTNKLLEHRFDKIFFTGSEFVGKLIAEAAAKHLTPICLELGGKSPTIVDRSANLVHAAERIAWATYLNAGQTCVRPDFCMVHEDVADEFFKVMKKTIRTFYSENPKKTEFYGRIINKKAFERLSDLVAKGKDFIIVGGDMDADERYIEPTVFDFGTDIERFQAQPIMQDEIFGPLLPCVRYSEIEDVVQFIRRLETGKPLACYAYATDKSVIDAISYRTTSGGLCINDSVMHLANHELPFGGVGRSGMGSYHGEHSFKAFTHEKSVLRKYPGLDESLGMKQLLVARFPPYTPLKQVLIKMFSMPISTTLLNLPFYDLVRQAKRLIFILLLARLCGYRVSKIR